MELTYTSEQHAFRAEVRAWLKDNLPRQPLASYDTREGFEQHRAWEATLFDSRLSMVMWPAELGGRGCGLIEWLIFEEEYYGAGAPMRVNQNGQLLLGPTLMEFGTEQQKKHFLPRMAASIDMWAQGWSEPNAGSDMAAITSKALLEGITTCSTARKPGRPGRSTPTGCSACFAVSRVLPAITGCRS